MECRTVRENMSALLDDALEPELAQAIRRHVDTCDECAALFGAMRSADADARSALQGVAEGAELSGQFTVRVLADIARRRPEALPLLRRPKVRRVALVAAAIVVIGVGIWAVISNRRGPGTDQVAETEAPVAPQHVILTTLDLPSVRGLVEELLGEDMGSPESAEAPDEAQPEPAPEPGPGPEGPDEPEPELNHKPSMVPTYRG